MYRIDFEKYMKRALEGSFRFSKLLIISFGVWFVNVVAFMFNKTYLKNLNYNFVPRVLIFLLVFLCLGFKNFAQLNIDFKNIQEKDGLSHNIVTNLLKDKNGFLWVATYDGLNRFDGSHFSVFKKNKKIPNSIIDNLVYDLAQDSNGDIWYSTSAGIGCYHKKNGQFENFVSDGNKPLGDVFNIICDKLGDTWFTTSKGLFKFSPKNKKFQLFENDSTKNNSMLKAVVSKNGMIEDKGRNGFWLTSDAGLMYFDLKTKQFFHHKNNPKHLEIFKNESTAAISLSSENKIAFGGNNDQIIVFDGVSGKITQQYSLKSNRTKLKGETASIFFDIQHNLWVSSWGYTLFKIDTKTQKINEFFNVKGDKNSVAADFFWAASQDDDGTLMLGTVNGISYTNPLKPFYQVYNLSKKLPELNANFGVLWVHEENAKSWWIGTHKNGLLHYNAVSDSLEVFPFEHRVNSVFTLGNKIFIASNFGFFTFDRAKKKYSEIKLPEEVAKNQKGIFDFFSQNDSTLWFSGYGKYILKYNINSKKFNYFDLEANIGEHKLLGGASVFFDKNNGVWASDWNGILFKLSPEKQAFFPIKRPENSEFEANFSLPIADKNNNFWIPAAKKGLLKYNPKQQKYQLWSESEGLVSDLIRAVDVDNFGQIWSSGFNKFSIFNAEKESFLNFTLPINETNYSYYNKLFRLKNGHILSSMQGHLIEFFPEQIFNYALAKAPLINHVYNAGSPIIYTSNNDEVNLKVEQNSFTIAFGYLPLSPINKYHYEYKLENFDKTWVKAGEESFANYSNLAGGDYTFMVRAINGEARSKIAQIKIHIETPFYKTWWFYSLIVASIAFATYSFYRYRLAEQKKFYHLREKAENLEKEKTIVQYESLKQHLNPHFLFNSLTSLRSLIKINPAQAATFLDGMSKVYRYVLKSGEQELTTLDVELDFAKTYIALQKTRFGNGLFVNIDVAEANLGKYIAPVTLQNLVENAIKHNTADVEAPLIIDIFTENEYIIIKNNLQRYRIMETSNKRGLNNLKSLYKFYSEKEMEIIDDGTNFTIKIPLI
jgi:streptogramin lyase